MQKKIQSKKAPKKGASQIKQKVKNKKYSPLKNKKTNADSIFNYDIETSNNKEENIKKVNKKIKTKKDSENEDSVFIGAKEIPQINKKQLDKIKKKKQKEISKKKKELLKQEAKEERKREKIRIQSNTKRMKKMRKIKNLVKYLTLIIILAIAIILLLLSPIFNIKDIEIENNNKVSKEEILSLLSIDENTNIFKETNGKIKSKLKINPYIDDAKISRNLPSMIKIQITERQANYMLEVGNSYAYIDNQGYILEISKTILEGKTKILGYSTLVESILPGNRICDDDMDKLNVVTQIIRAVDNNNIANIVTSINIENQEDYLLYLESEKKIVHLGDRTNLDTKMIYVKAIIEKEKGKEGEIFVNRDLNKKDPYFKEKV